MRYIELLSSYEEKLADLGEDKENLRYVFKEMKGWSNLDFLLSHREEVTQQDQALLDKIFQELSQHRSPQYITGQAYFRELMLSVDERVLIPRPETEELVTLILSENQRTDLSVLDIGTGSGAIALALKSAQETWSVTASDISNEALQVSQKNSQTNHLPITFIQSDLFENISGTFDIIVSNPPYISYEDKAEVGLNVLTSEPHLALFAEENGLAIYKRIISQADDYLTSKGKLYFEIGYNQGEMINKLLTQAFPDKRVRVLQDMFGKDRMVVVDNG